MKVEKWHQGDDDFNRLVNVYSMICTHAFHTQNNTERHGSDNADGVKDKSKQCHKHKLMTVLNLQDTGYITDREL